MIGVNSFSARQGENLNYAVSVADVQELLKQTGDVFPEDQPKEASARPADKDGCSEPQVLFKGPNKGNSADIILLDTTCKDTPDAELILPHDPKRPDMLAYFAGDYSKRTVVYFDYTHKGDWTLSIWRENPTDPWQLACYHENHNLKPVRCVKYETYVTSAEAR